MIGRCALQSVSLCCMICLMRLTASAVEVEYLRDIKPILRERCFACHGALKQESGLRVDSVAALRQGGDSGAAVDPGNASESLLLDRVSSEDTSYRMPPEGKPLEPPQVE